MGGTMIIRNITVPVMLVAACTLTYGQGTINTVAGAAKCCNSADGGQATSTWIPSTSGITFDSKGNLYIWDTQSAKIRLVNPAGVITTAAGNGTPGYMGDGGPAINAELFASGS